MSVDFRSWATTGVNIGVAKLYAKLLPELAAAMRVVNLLQSIATNETVFAQYRVGGSSCGFWHASRGALELPNCPVAADAHLQNIAGIYARWPGVYAFWFPSNNFWEVQNQRSVWPLPHNPAGPCAPSCNRVLQTSCEMQRRNDWRPAQQHPCTAQLPWREPKAGALHLVRLRWAVPVLRGSVPARFQQDVCALCQGLGPPQRTLRAGELGVLSGWGRVLSPDRMALAPRVCLMGACRPRESSMIRVAWGTMAQLACSSSSLQCIGNGACEWCIEPSVCRQCRDGWGLTPAGTCIVVRVGWAVGCIHMVDGAAAAGSKLVPQGHMPT